MKMKMASTNQSKKSENKISIMKASVMASAKMAMAKAAKHRKLAAAWRSSRHGVAMAKKSGNISGISVNNMYRKQ